MKNTELVFEFGDERCAITLGYKEKSAPFDAKAFVFAGTNRANVTIQRKAGSDHMELLIIPDWDNTTELEKKNIPLSLLLPGGKTITIDCSATPIKNP